MLMANLVNIYQHLPFGSLKETADFGVPSTYSYVLVDRYELVLVRTPSGYSYRYWYMSWYTCWN